MKILVIFTATLFVSAFGYNFDDVVFNNFLTNVLYNGYTNYQEPMSIRNRRAIEIQDRKCYLRPSINCCGESSDIGLNGDVEQLRDECFEASFDNVDFPLTVDMFSCENIEQLKNKVICMANCIARKINMIENNQINIEVVKTLIETALPGSSEHKKEIIPPIIDKCTSNARQAVEEHKFECSPLALKLFHCLWRAIQLDCPVDQIKDTPTCNRIIEKLKAEENR